jgi:dihydrolipoyl dehydrogenase
MLKKYDVLIIGSGPGGYVAAVRAAQLGLKAAVIEKAHVGGVCPNWGCIPTKALLRSADIYQAIKRAEDHGITVGDVNIDLPALVSRSRGIADQMSDGVESILDQNEVELIWGTAKITGKGRVRVEAGEADVEPPEGALGAGEYAADHIIIATGARPRVRELIEPDGKFVWSSYEAMIPTEIPKSLLVVGAGAIGVEYATFFQLLGSEVTILASRKHIVPMEDVEISKHVRKMFEDHGMTIRTESKIVGVKKNKDDVTVTIEGRRGKVVEQNFERIISAVGVCGNIEGIGLEEMGVATDDGIVVADGFGRTNVDGIYAVGDVAGGAKLAHKASHEGSICIDAIANQHPHPLDKLRVPACTFCSPQIASLGLTEAQARDAGHEIRVGRFQFAGNGKAVAFGEPEGLVKTIFDAKTGKLLGAHMVGSEVAEQIQGFVVAMNLETTEQELINCIFPHPTISETMHESVLDAYDRAIHC